MSSNDIVIRAENISKSYRIYDRPQDRLKQFVWRGRKTFFREFWALQPLCFDVKRGECVGFIGRNGSGKSTLLQILAGILQPTHGIFETKGRVSALLELGAGFNMDFSGRENVYLNAAIMGLSRSEIDQRFSKIEEFAEIGDFIEQPVKTYSSGMYVRLAFAVAIHLDPDILIVDEALAVGDAAFQYKCFRKIEQLRERGTSILFVTHDTQAVKQFCNRVGWLDAGRLVTLGDATEVSHLYEDYLRQKMAASVRSNAEKPQTEAAARIEQSGIQHARILKAELIDDRGVASDLFIQGADMRLRLTYEVFQSPPEGIVLGAAIFRSDDLYVCGLNTGLDKFQPNSDVGVHSVEIHYPKIPLLAGSYYFKAGAFDASGLVRWDFHHRAASFSVTSPYVAEGVFVLDHRWKS